MPTLRSNLTYVVSNTFITDTNEIRAEVVVSYIDVQANVNVDIATINLGLGTSSANDSNIAEIMATSFPQYFE
jgi:hypothetical protein